MKVIQQCHSRPGLYFFVISFDHLLCVAPVLLSHLEWRVEWMDREPIVVVIGLVVVLVLVVFFVVLLAKVP
jgi:hypothetical protein